MIRTCNTCAHFNEDDKCAHKDGIFAPLENISEKLADAEHDCKVFEEITYTLAPKGILHIALEEADIDFTDEQLDDAWGFFEEKMIEMGYIHDKDNLE